jgi:hypothetical protein
VTQKFEYQGVVYDVIPRTEMTWAEADKLEEITGLTSSEMAEDRHQGHSRVSAAHAWISMQRAAREATKADRVLVVPDWPEYRETPMKDTVVLPQEETEEPPPLSAHDPDDPTESTAAPEPGSGTSDGST